jgi:hypothetical protein
MPRCKALVRGGSRRCRRQALNGTGFCSIHGGSSTRRAGSTRSLAHSSASGRAPRAPSRITGASHPSHKGYYRTIRNPHFGMGDIVRHVYTDKVGDLSRTVSTAASVNLALAPITPWMIGLGPGGVAARAALGIGGTLAISGPMQTMDMYRDAYQFLRTGEIGGQRITAHEYVTN